MLEVLVLSASPPMIPTSFHAELENSMVGFTPEAAPEITSDQLTVPAGTGSTS